MISAVSMYKIFTFLDTTSLTFRLSDRSIPTSLLHSKSFPCVFAVFLSHQAPVSQESGIFSGLFRVPRFPLYLRNAEVLSNQTSQSCCFFIHYKDIQRSAFQNKRIAV